MEGVLKKQISVLLIIVISAIFSNCSTAGSSTGDRDSKNLKLLEENVESADSFFVEGKASFEKREYANALISFRKSKYTQVVFFTGLALSELGRKEEARDVFKDCVGRNILADESYYNLSMIAYDLGDLVAAKDYAYKSINLNPEHTGALFFAGNLNYLENNMEKALEYYDLALKTDPSSIDIWEAVFSVYLSTEKYEEAWKIRDKVDRKNPETVLSVLKLAEITGNFADGYQYPDKEALKYEKVREMVRILFSKSGDFKKALEMAQKENGTDGKKYVLIDRLTTGKGSYVIGYANDEMFLVCSNKSTDLIPLEIVGKGIKIKGMEIVFEGGSAPDILEFCNAQK
jgi:tetratricopeptide (TPR) repeat protein